MQYTDITCETHQAANALHAYLTSEIKEQEEDPKISVQVDDRTLHITYGHDNEEHRNDWDKQMIGYRDAFELMWPFYSVPYAGVGASVVATGN